jgi:hypothetical protein
VQGFLGNYQYAGTIGRPLAFVLGIARPLAFVLGRKLKEAIDVKRYHS